MRSHEHADELTPDQRFQHVAALLATGLRRLRPNSAFPDDPKNPPELSPNGLEFSAETRLTIQTG
jgi:hypothetical protein